MNKRRREKTERQVRLLEAEFRELLVVALRGCAAGQWGLFGRNDAALSNYSPELYARLKSKEAERLLELGEAIQGLRGRLGCAEPFAPYERFLATRRMAGANAPGEPKLACAWLDEIEQDRLP